MAAKSHVPFYVKAANVMTSTLLRAGVKLKGAKKYPMYLVTVPGRKSGIPRTTPIAVIELNNKRYLVAPYGAVDWVRNLRAAGGGTLTRGSFAEPVTAAEVPPSEGGPVIRNVVESGISIASYFNLKADASAEQFEALIADHPVFALQSVAAGAA